MLPPDSFPHVQILKGMATDAWWRLSRGPQALLQDFPDIPLACRGKSSNVALLPVKAGKRGVETPLIKLGHSFTGAGWHARMSSRQR